MRYTSPEWIAAAGRALADDAGLKDATVDLQLTIEQVVTGCPGGDDSAGGAGGSGGAGAVGATVRWHVAIDHGRVELAEGPAEAADLRFTTTYDTAAAVASGALAAQRAFAEGRLRVGGDLSLLVAHHRTLASLDDALAAVRAGTEY